MNVESLLARLFPGGHEVRVDGDFIDGNATVGGGPDAATIAVTGTAHGAAIGVELAHAMAGSVLRTVSGHPGRPLLLLVDTQGQRLRRRDELLGINAYMAHLAKCVDIARRRGHRVVSLVYGRAVSGGYIASGMMADRCYALQDAELSVMNLPAMSRVTKIPLQRLEELAQTSPVFAPGAGNYVAMGALDALWSGDLQAALAAALAAGDDLGHDGRRERGAARGGRLAALAVARQVRHGGLA
ncbi:MAG TPA: biotin-independent malonate decarboxylase subunit gamma [Burkholderiaceae bacterium]|nr:biotin-independent malonate decarboxylase subunit gamma [Burkholderiaceae bacterium]